MIAVNYLWRLSACAAAGTVFTQTSNRFGLHAQQPCRQQRFDALSGVLDRPLPVLGGAAAADRLELVGRQPGPVEEHAPIARSLLAGRHASSEVHERLVVAARYCDVHSATERQRLCNNRPVILFDCMTSWSTAPSLVDGYLGPFL